MHYSWFALGGGGVECFCNAAGDIGTKGVRMKY